MVLCRWEEEHQHMPHVLLLYTPKVSGIHMYVFNSLTRTAAVVAKGSRRSNPNLPVDRSSRSRQHSQLGGGALNWNTRSWRGTHDPGLKVNLCTLAYALVAVPGCSALPYPGQLWNDRIERVYTERWMTPSDGKTLSTNFPTCFHNSTLPIFVGKQQRGGCHQQLVCNTCLHAQLRALTNQWIACPPCCWYSHGLLEKQEARVR